MPSFATFVGAQADLMAMTQQIVFYGMPMRPKHRRTKRSSGNNSPANYRRFFITARISLPACLYNSRVPFKLGNRTSSASTAAETRSIASKHLL